MAESHRDSRTLAEEIGEAIVGDADPERLEGFSFARRILPTFRLVRALFSQSEADTCLKLMVLYELTRLGGRWSIERIRTHARFLEAGRVEALVRSLREGGWLDLRDSDHTYAISPEGVHLLSVLHAADFGNLAPANALARAAQNAAFGATLEGADGDAAGYLLEQLLVLLEDQVEQATTVLQLGRPHRMIEWSRREHRRQLETIQQVLNTLQERLDAASGAFQRVVRLHGAMQEVVRLHTGIHGRLREWNLDRLYTADAGYSIPELLDAVLGAEDADFARALAAGILQGASLPPTLTGAELRERIHGARRKLPSQAEHYEYEPPTPAEMQPLAATDLDPAATLRARLTALLADRSPGDPPLELDEWMAERAFPDSAWWITLLARLEGGRRRFTLDDGREVEAELTTPLPRGVGPDQLLPWFVDQGALRRLDSGWFARVRLRLMPRGSAAASSSTPDLVAG